MSIHAHKSMMIALRGSLDGFLKEYDECTDDESRKQKLGWLEYSARELAMMIDFQNTENAFEDNRPEFKNHPMGWVLRECIPRRSGYFKFREERERELAAKEFRRLHEREQHHIRECAAEDFRHVRFDDDGEWSWVTEPHEPGLVRRSKN